MLNKNPCTRECPDRTAECKKTCPKWAIYEKGKMEEYAERKIKYEEAMAYSEAVGEAVKRMKRGKRK